MVVVVALIAGMLVGQFFKWYFLIPACGLAGILILTNTAYEEYSLLGLVVKIIVVFTSLQVGYVVALAARNFLVVPKRSQHLDARNLDKPPSNDAEPDKFDKQAA